MPESDDERAFGEALDAALRQVSLLVARDGEGARRVGRVLVRGGDPHWVERVAHAVADSPLVKTSLYGADPNWGRVAMAIGKCQDDRDIDPERVVIRFGDLETYPDRPDEKGLVRLAEIMAADHVEIEIELRTGSAESTVYGCDLSADYVRINADYTT